MRSHSRMLSCGPADHNIQPLGSNHLFTPVFLRKPLITTRIHALLDTKWLLAHSGRCIALYLGDRFFIPKVEATCERSPNALACLGWQRCF